MRRRQFLLSTGLAALGASTFPMRWVPAADGQRKRILYFTRSSGFQHSVVKRKGNELAYSEKIMTEWGQKHGFDVECTKDGSVFDGDLNKYDAFAFYTTGVLTHADDAKKLAGGDNGGTPPMSEKGKQRFLDAIQGGKGFIGFHSSTDSFHSPAPKPGQEPQYDPYIAMIGGEFIIHGAQQPGTLKAIDGSFPGISGLPAEIAVKQEEWYSLKYFAKDLHVILLQLTQGMKGDMYERPNFPQTWARMQGQGRVYYTSFGHREDIWTNPQVEQIMLGGLAWVLGNASADVTPNVQQVAPGAWVMPVIKPRQPAKPKNQPVAK